jgi:putative hemolysin
MIWIVLLLLVGIFLSAFYSGNETGFYRVSRVRLVLDGLGGNLVSRGLLWLTNNPSLFVGTTLVGNNVANYLTSLAIVLGTRELFHRDAEWAELIAPVVLSPLVFIYGELLPKNMFYYAPNRMLHRGAPLFFLSTVLFAPISALLWLLGRALQSLLGEAPVTVQLMLARKELQQVLREGQDVGILKPAQRTLAHNLFSVANEPVIGFCLPAARVVTVKLGSRTDEVLRLARRHHLSTVAVTEAQSRKLLGYVRIVDLHLNRAERIETVRPLLEIAHDETNLAALLRMQSERETLARVIDDRGETIGLLYANKLTDRLFTGS